MLTLIGIFSATTVLWLCYWALLRPFILDSVEDELRRMRSKLDWAMIEGLPGAQSEAAFNLENSLRDYEVVRWLSISQAVYAVRSKSREVKAQATKEQEIYKSAPVWIKDMNNRQGVISMKAALANSPSWWVPLAVVLLFTFFSRSVEQFWKETEIATRGLQRCGA